MMHTSDVKWWRAHSADYVLGLLTNAERLVFERILPTEPELQEFVADWRETLQPISDALPPIQPPEHILPSLIANLPTNQNADEIRQYNNATQGDYDSDTDSDLGIDSDINDATQDYSESQYYDSNDDSTLDNSVSIGTDMVVSSAATDASSSRSGALPISYSTDDQLDNRTGERAINHVNASPAVLAEGTAFMRLVESKQNNIDGWRSFAGLATVACLLMSLLGWMGFQRLQSDKVEPTFDGISIVQNNEAQALWVIDTSADAKTLRATAIAPPALEEGQAFELWMVNSSDGSVVSMGLLPTKSNTTAQIKAHRFSGEAESFSVSVETAKGSAQSIPTGPVLYQGNIQLLSN